MQTREVHRPAHPRRLRFVRGLAAVTVAGLVLAACGNGEEAPDAAPADEEPTDVEEPDDSEEPDDAEEPDDSEEPDEPAEDWPTDTIRILVGASEGGGLDTLARILQGPLAEELGVDVIVENPSGAQTSIANTIAYNEGDECDVIVHQNFPIVLFSYLINDVDYTYDDMYPIAATQNQPSVLVVPGDSPIDTYDDLIEEARSRPGELTASLSAIASTNAVGIAQIERIEGIDVNMIDYDGGSPARQALLAGEVDFSHTSVFAAMPLLEGGELKILGAHQTPEDWELFSQQELLQDVQTLSEITGNEEFGSNTATYGMTANRTCYEDYPERYQRLVDAFDTVMSSDEYMAQLEDLGLELSVLDIDPDEYHERLLREVDAVNEVAEDLLG